MTTVDTPDTPFAVIDADRLDRNAARLREHLHGLGVPLRLPVPVHVVWGESDGIIDPGYGKAFAAAIPQSTFTLLPRTGHLPQVESPEELLDAVLSVR